LTILSSPLCASFRTPGLLPSSFPRFALAAQAFLHPRMLFCTRVRFLPLYISNFFAIETMFFLHTKLWYYNLCLWDR